jgi:hypothetical protein
MEKKYKVIIGVLAAVAAILLGVLIYVLVQKNTMKQDISGLTIDKTTLTQQMTQLQNDYANLSSTNDTINTQLQVEREKVAQLIQKVNSTKSTDQAKLMKYERELGTLRSIMRGYIRQIDSLNTLNVSLKKETAAAKQEAQESNTKYNDLKTTTDELGKQVEKGSVVKGRGLTIVGLNGNGKETNRSSRVQKLKSCLNLVENSIAKTGPMTVYIRVKGPDGILMTNGGQQVFTAGGEQMIYSASREVDYEGAEIEVCIYFDPAGAKFTKGVYTIDAYTNRGLLGTAQIYLK